MSIREPSFRARVTGVCLLFCSALALLLAFFIWQTGSSTNSIPKTIPHVIVVSLCMPSINAQGQETETGAQYAACVNEVTQAWYLAATGVTN